ncbi:MAG: (Fe-S)-binding protein [Planctomycetota bacterium]
MKSDDLASLPTLNDCVHCGLCLPACPTYFATGREAESPRGRIAALRAIAEGRTALTPGLATGLDDCLVCRACESHCPSGISMEAMITGYRERFTPTRAAREVGAPPLSWRARLGRWLERVVLLHVFPMPVRVRLAARMIAWIAPVLRRLPGLVARLDLPAAHRLRRPARIPEEWVRGLSSPSAAPHASGAPEPRGTVALLRGCVTDVWFREELLATARVLRHNGYEVSIAGPACCGALHHHAGLGRTADELTERAVSQLIATGAEHVVIESAGCAPALCEPRGTATRSAESLAARVIDPLGLLDRGGWRRPRRQLPGRWVVAPPCHHRHGPLSDEGVRRVLQDTLEEGYMELPPPELCCGAAGFFSVRRPQLSRQIGHAARARFDASGATGVLTGNPGCLLRWEALLASRGVPTLHPVMALDRAYQLGGDYDGARDSC